MIKNSLQKELYLFFLQVLCVKLERVELNGVRARVFNDDLCFNLHTEWQTRPHGQLWWTKDQFWVFTLPKGCDDHRLRGLIYSYY